MVISSLNYRPTLDSWKSEESSSSITDHTKERPLSSSTSLIWTEFFLMDHIIMCQDRCTQSADLLSHLWKLRTFLEDKEQSCLRKIRSYFRKKIEKFNLTENFNKTMLGQKLLKNAKKSKLTDFESFKAMVLKKKASGLIKKNTNSLLKKKK